MESSTHSKLESVKAEQFIYLTTIGRNSGRSFTKELWFALGDGKIYLSHEGNHTDWMKNIAKNSHVTLKIGSFNFEATARILGESPSRELGKKALYEKYYRPASKEVVDDWFELSTVIELVPL
jgi:deazaflavin-dependent oxidoreductase (nitroreductase family)